ncbi:PAS domain S-box protein [bacterium]|nr:MAG: PAS domain S-box protein [bacterium]
MSEGFFGPILACMEEGVIFLDHEDVIRYINPAAERIRKVRAARLVGRHILSIHKGQTRERVEELLESLKAGPHVSRDRVVRVGDRYFDNTYTAIFDGEGKFVGTLLISRDATAKKILADENSRLRNVLDEPGGEEFIAVSPSMRHALDTVTTVAPLDSTVLITGESGSGKEHFAELVHRLSSRNDGPLVRVNCAAIPENLIESELFGHVRGSFTGAVTNQTGKFLKAQGGTLFLDEIGELPLSSQAKILRAIQHKKIQPVGSPEEREVDVRIVAATNRDLLTRVREGHFREDLFYRLNVIKLTVPPLRERPEDIEALADAFIARFSRKMGRTPLRLSDEARALLVSHPLPGNVRQLMHAIERAVAFAKGDLILVNDFPSDLREPARSEPPVSHSAGMLAGQALREALERCERDFVTEALQKCGGKKIQAAKMLGISRKNLWEKITRFAIEDSEQG